MRGGGFFSFPLDVRSADRTGHVPTYRLFFNGFRPARTFR
jgi:hypothetical protein